MKPNFRQFIKFCVVGTISMIVDVGSYTLLTRMIQFFYSHYLLANAIAFIVSLIISYVLNKKFTFQNNNKAIGVQFTKYVGVYTVGLVISEILLYILVDRIGIYDLIAKMLVIGAVLFWNFTGSKFFIFDKDVHGKI
ncbi:MAG: GtrA family protein [Candidatus Gracilibacteria bacterium]|jgi:putative flippase GtrA